MNDFIRHLSFNSQSPFTPGHATSEVLRGVLRSFNETPAPAFRPSPQRIGGRSKIQNRKSKILS
jgi:hypothetical protein